MKNIILLGFMGTGKTAVAKKLAGRLNLSFVEMDSIIEEREGVSINEIFEKKGEPYFRKIESDVVNELSEKEDLVVSTGGGVVLNPGNLEALKKKGLLVCLDAGPEEILRRISGQTYRPLLNVKDPLSEIKKLLAFRKPFYDKIKIHINTDGKNIEEVAKEIKKMLNTKY